MAFAYFRMVGIFSVTFLIGLYAVFLLSREPLVALFTNDEDLINWASKYFYVMILAACFDGMQCSM